jgi:hypothetical protein
MNKKNIMLVLVLLTLSIPTAQAQVRMTMEAVEDLSRPEWIPQAEYHLMFQQFWREHYPGRNYVTIDETSDIMVALLIYLPRDELLKKYEAAEKTYRTKQAKAEAARVEAARKAEAARQAEQERKAEEERKAREFAERYNYRLAADQNLHADQDFGSSVVMPLKKGTPVHIEAYGEYTDFEDTTAKWARVATPDGKSGWLFSGYLEEF